MCTIHNSVRRKTHYYSSTYYYNIYLKNINIYTTRVIQKLKQIT